MTEKLLTIQEVAERLGMTEGWVIDHTGAKAEDAIPSIKLGKYRRYRPEDVDAWLARQVERPEKAA